MDTPKITSIERSDFPKIANIWTESIAEDIFSIFGKNYIENIYLPFAFSRLNTFGDIVSINNRTVGFVIFGPSNNFFLSLVRKNLISTIYASITACLKKPKNFLILIGILYFAIFGLPKYEKNSLELLYIAVLPQFQKNNLGTRLINNSENIINNLSPILYVKTLSSNKDFIQFYKKNGFTIKESKLGRVFMAKKTQSSNETKNEL